MRSWPFHPLMRNGGRPSARGRSGAPAAGLLAPLVERAKDTLRKLANRIKRILTIVRKTDDLQLVGPRVTTRIFDNNRTVFVTPSHHENLAGYEEHPSQEPFRDFGKVF